MDSSFSSEETYSSASSPFPLNVKEDLEEYVRLVDKNKDIASDLRAKITSYKMHPLYGEKVSSIEKRLVQAAHDMKEFNQLLYEIVIAKRQVPPEESKIAELEVQAASKQFAALNELSEIRYWIQNTA